MSGNGLCLPHRLADAVIIIQYDCQHICDISFYLFNSHTVLRALVNWILFLSFPYFEDFFLNVKNDSPKELLTHMIFFFFPKVFILHTGCLRITRGFCSKCNCNCFPKESELLENAKWSCFKEVSFGDSEVCTLCFVSGLSAIQKGEAIYLTFHC